MTYITCKKVIENKKKILTGESWESFVHETSDKLDVFLLNNRITQKQHSELSAMLKDEL